MSKRSPSMTKKGDHEQGIVFLEKALSLFFDTVGEQHPEVARSYIALGHWLQVKLVATLSRVSSCFIQQLDP